MDNTPARVDFREKILALEKAMFEEAEKGLFVPYDFPVEHHFSPIHPVYGCCVYARPCFIPKGHLVIGKIHKQSHLNFCMKGKVVICSEQGQTIVEAPAITLSEAGAKKAIVALEDAIWVTACLTKHHGVEHLAEVEDELVTTEYKDVGLVCSLNELGEQP